MSKFCEAYEILSDMTLTRVEGYNYWLEGQHVNLYMIPLDVIVIPGNLFFKKLEYLFKSK